MRVSKVSGRAESAAEDILVPPHRRRIEFRKRSRVNLREYRLRARVLAKVAASRPARRMLAIRVVRRPCGLAKMDRFHGPHRTNRMKRTDTTLGIFPINPAHQRERMHKMALEKRVVPSERIGEFHRSYPRLSSHGLYIV